jgi:hypothetical protein
VVRRLARAGNWRPDSSYRAKKKGSEMSSLASPRCAPGPPSSSAGPAWLLHPGAPAIAALLACLPWASAAAFPGRPPRPARAPPLVPSRWLELRLSFPAAVSSWSANKILTASFDCGGRVRVEWPHAWNRQAACSLLGSIPARME